LHSIADGVIVLDSNNQIVITNPAAQHILRDVAYSTTEVEKTRPTNLNEDKALLEWLTQLTASAQVQRYKVGNRVFSALTSPVTKPDESRYGSVIVMRDITREVEAEERQNAFITNISHELRTPLTSVKGYISLLLANGQEGLSGQYRQFAEIIDNNTDILVEHVNRLMEITEIQTGTLKLDRERISLIQIVEETIQAWETKMERKQLSFSLDIDCKELWVSGDATRLTWAIENILQNAHDYTYEGGSVHVQVNKQDNQAQISVTDTGVGINATDQPYIFERFSRIENELTINTPGMGLGLFIVRFIVESHAGRVTVESQPGRGSTFTITLPLDTNE
jgi:signal transduction histidine kinase